MQISLSKFSVVLTGIVSAGLVIGAAYLLFTLFFKGPVPDANPVLTLATVGVFGPKYQRASAALVDPANKISLDKNKNLQFLNSELYQSFTESPFVVQLSESRGRADPFVPLYVAP
jgi:hypothetical protein